MVWRIYFTAADLARTTISAPLGPLAETTMALSLLRCPLQPSSLFSDWRHRAVAQITAQMKPLLILIPAGSRGVDLCTLTGDPRTMEQGAQALMTMPRDQVLAEMGDLHRHHRLPASAWAAAEAGSEARLRLADATDATYRALVEPYWGRIRAHLRAEQYARGQILMHGGVERLLTTLQTPRLRWRPPVLEIDIPGSTDVQLAGRGLTLVPSLFVGEIPALLRDLHDERAVPRLVFPAGRNRATDTALWRRPRSGSGALAALVGRTRAATLNSIADGCTTTELAHRVGVSLAAASQHATVLREAGLISTSRHGSAVRHTLTQLGGELLDAGSSADEPRLADRT